MHDCNLHNGYIDKLTVTNITSRLQLINTTFECCGKIDCENFQVVLLTEFVCF